MADALATHNVQRLKSGSDSSYHADVQYVQFTIVILDQI